MRHLIIFAIFMFFLFGVCDPQNIILSCQNQSWDVDHRNVQEALDDDDNKYNKKKLQSHRWL